MKKLTEAHNKLCDQVMNEQNPNRLRTYALLLAHTQGCIQNCLSHIEKYSEK